MTQFHLPLSEEDELAGGSPNVLVFPSLFREAMDMIFDAYAFFEFQDLMEEDLMPTPLSSLMSNEMSRVTMRLTSVMAWLMARKAVQAGQLDEEEAATHYRIEGEQYCLEQPPGLQGLLPDYMFDLLERSYALYLRVWRLDKQL